MKCIARLISQSLIPGFFRSTAKMVVLSRLAVAVQFFSVPVFCAVANQQYDYVIVGGGITGLIVANRLSEDKSRA